MLNKYRGPNDDNYKTVRWCIWEIAKDAGIVHKYDEATQKKAEAIEQGENLVEVISEEPNLGDTTKTRATETIDKGKGKEEATSLSEPAEITDAAILADTDIDETFFEAPEEAGQDHANQQGAGGSKPLAAAQKTAHTEKPKKAKKATKIKMSNAQISSDSTAGSTSRTWRSDSQVSSARQQTYSYAEPPLLHDTGRIVPNFSTCSSPFNDPHDPTTGVKSQSTDLSRSTRRETHLRSPTPPPLGVAPAATGQSFYSSAGMFLLGGAMYAAGGLVESWRRGGSASAPPQTGQEQPEIFEPTPMPEDEHGRSPSPVPDHGGETSTGDKYNEPATEPPLKYDPEKSTKGKERMSKLSTPQPEDEPLHTPSLPETSVETDRYYEPTIHPEWTAPITDTPVATDRYYEPTVQDERTAPIVNNDPDVYNPGAGFQNPDFENTPLQLPVPEFNDEEGRVSGSCFADISITWQLDQRMCNPV
jgi:hypothetical protein